MLKSGTRGRFPQAAQRLALQLISRGAHSLGLLLVHKSCLGPCLGPDLEPRIGPVLALGLGVNWGLAGNRA